MCSVVAVPGVYCRTTSRPGRPSITTYFRIWHIDGVWEQLNTALRERLRVRWERNPQPSAGMVDSQSAKTTGRAAKREATTESTLRRKIEGFRTNGMENLSSTEKARRKQLPPTIRRLIVDLKGEDHAFNTNEISNIAHACPGRKPDVRSVRRVLDEEPLPLRILREHPRYRDGKTLGSGGLGSWSCAF